MILCKLFMKSIGFIGLGQMGSRMATNLLRKNPKTKAYLYDTSSSALTAFSTFQNATVVELTHRLLPAMIERKQGGIITISSMAGFQPIPFASVYSATKAFLTTFSLALEAEVARFGVRVVTVCPGRLRVSPEDAENSGEPSNEHHQWAL